MAVNSGQYKTSYITKLTDYTETDVEGVGTLRIENGKKYKWVKMTTGTATLASVVGHVVGYLATDTGLHTVCTDYSDCMATLLAGTLGVAGITTGYYCWLQIGGISAILTNTIASTVVGKTVGLSADNQLLLEAADTTFSGAVIVDATGSAEKVYLTCPE